MGGRSAAFPAADTRLPAAAALGLGVGVLGGLIGLGGAEFRLPLLITVFGFAALPAVIVNKAMSLIVVATALPARGLGVPLDAVADEWAAVLNLLAGSLVGAWLGATWATRIRSATLYRVLAVLLVLMAAALAANHAGTIGPASLPGGLEVAAGVAAGLGIGIVAALMGVAGGELLIPTFVLLFAADVKVAGTLSLAVSLPTMLVAFARYSRDDSFAVLRRNRSLVVVMALASVVGTVIGGALVGVVAAAVIVPLLVALLLLSALKVWRHERPAAVRTA